MSNLHDMLRSQRVTPRRPLSNNFTEDIMDIIKEKPRKRSLAERLHLTVPDISYRLTHAPKIAIITLAVVAAGTGTAAAYGAYHWLIPKIDILGITAQNDDHKREFAVNIKDCGIMVGGQTADNGVQRYEVAPDANLTDEQVIKVLENSCKYQQLLQLSNEHWQDTSTIGKNPGDAVVTTMAGVGGENVINDPWVGKITALSDTSITIESTVYQEYTGPSIFKAGDPIPDPETTTKYYPHGKKLSRTLPLKLNVDVIANGETVPRSELKVGDTIMFESEIRTTIGADGAWVKPADVKVAHIIKTDIDPTYVQPMWVGDPNIVNAVVRLEGCQGNSDYLCIASKSAQLQSSLVYFFSPNTETQPTPDKRFEDNRKYMRTDIDPYGLDTGKYYRTIEGRILTLGDNKLVLQSRGKVQQFTVALPYDVVSQFNQTQKQTLKTGDYLQVIYLQKDDENRTDIKPTDLYGINLLMRQLPDGTTKKY
jgi:hypothetical protein